MKNVLVLSLLALTLGFGQHAEATNDATGPAYGCELDVNLHGKQRGFILAYKRLEGHGTMTCRSVTGDVLPAFPIYMSIEGWGFGAGWGDVRNQKFLTGSIGVTQPGYMYGKWSGQINGDATLIEVNGTVGVGVEFNRNDERDEVRGLALKGVLSGGQARGLFLGVTAVEVQISPIGRR